MVNTCVVCDTTFHRKNLLMKHMRIEHGILQPYQCFACLKRYACLSSLCNHRRLYCKGAHLYNPVETEIYTISSFIHTCEDGIWEPVSESLLKCLLVENGFVGVVYNEQIVGYVPEKFVNVFKNFLQHGEIYVRCAGAIVHAEFGYLIPVDYIFHGSSENLHRLASELQNSENSPNMDSEQYDTNGVQYDGQHTLTKLPPTEKRLRPRRGCIDCKKRGIRKDTRYFCNNCLNNPALCKDCFYRTH